MVKLKAFSLIETLVAFTIIILIFGLSTSVYVQITKATNHQLRLKAYSIIQQQSQESVLSNDFIDDLEESDGIIIEKEVNSLCTGIIVISYKAKYSEKIIASWEKVISVNETD